VKVDHKSPVETAGSDCCSSDSRPNSRGSSIEIRLSQGNKSRGPSREDGDSDVGNDYESEVHISGSGTSASPSQGNSENKSLLTGGSQSNNNLNGSGSKRKKKTRTVFSRSQVFQLESTFDVKRYLSSSERAGLAASLHLTETQVTFPLHCLPYMRLYTPTSSLSSWNSIHLPESLHLYIIPQPRISLSLIRSRFGSKIAGTSGRDNLLPN